MADQEPERPGVTEMHVRMDCNGCVNRIKKALHGVEGIYDVRVDFPLQKLTVVGRATPETIVKAIKKTRKIATVCSHTEPGAPAPAAAAQAEADPPAPAEAPPAESGGAAATPPAEAAQTPAGDEAAAAEVPKPSPEATGAATGAQPPEEPPADDKNVEEVHTIHHHQYYNPYPYHHRRGDQDHYWADYPIHGGRTPYGHVPYAVVPSYSRYHRPTPEYGYLRAAAPESFGYAVAEPYGADQYHDGGNNGGGSSITSMFSDENPNACTIA